MDFALFVSLNPEKLRPISRLGTGIPGQRAAVMIGAERNLEEPSRIDYHPEQVVGIPADEYRRHRREYEKQIAQGFLLRRTKADWEKANAPPTAEPKPKASKKGPAKRQPKAESSE